MATSQNQENQSGIKGDAVVYYCGGSKPVIELLVSIYTLRKYYQGQICVLVGETSVKMLQHIIEDDDVYTIIVPNTENDKHKRQHWASRWAAMDLLPYDRVLHPDCDVLIVKSIDFFFDHINPDPEYVTSMRFYNPDRPYGRWRDHFADFRRACVKEKVTLAPDTVPMYMEFGLIAWNKGWPLAAEVSRWTRKLRDDQQGMTLAVILNGRKASKAIYDPERPSYLPMKLGRPYWRLTKEQFDETVIWHKNYGFAMWWREFFEARERGLYKLDNDEYIKQTCGPAHKMLVGGTYPKVLTYGGKRLKINS